jgi:mono/diheme cytochrome c family protein
MRLRAVLFVAVAIVGLIDSRLGALPLFHVGQASSDSSGPRPQSVPDGAYTVEQARRGDGVYRRKCASCHGAEFDGDGEATALVGSSFISEWSGRSVGDLFDRILKTMPDDDPGTLSNNECSDVVARLLNANKFPSGKTELPADLPALSLIPFKAK